MDGNLEMGISTEVEFNPIMFEKKLQNLKDSQDSINACCQWCLSNKQHHKKIVNCWLNVLKRVKVEQRLTLFYLANDVIQYSKRRNYDFVESWGTSLQKATTLVRDEKVKHKVLRIFKIWEQRSIYGEEFLADLCGLISVSPSTRKTDEPHEFQSAYLIQKVKSCTKLESDTDAKLKHLKEHHPKIEIESESLISSFKDRAHVDDVEKEIEDYCKDLESYVNALKLEIKSRISLITLLTQAATQLANDKKDVKVVSAAYKTFYGRVKELKKALIEKLPNMPSPIPSPDVNAPSPSPDSDIENSNTDNSDLNMSQPVNSLHSKGLITDIGYYNPVPPPTTDLTNSNFGSNNFSSFIGSDLSFNVANASSLFGNGNANDLTIASSNTSSQITSTNNYDINEAISTLFPSMACPPPPPVSNAPNMTAPPPSNDFQHNSSSHVPLMPPPMPPFSKPDDVYGASSYSDNSYNNANTNSNYANQNQYDSTSYQTNNNTTSIYSAPTPNLQSPPPTTAFDAFNPDYLAYQNPEPTVSNYSASNTYAGTEEYNPEEEPDTWDVEPSWEEPPPIQLDTPESPPLFEKKGYGDPVEYHDATVFTSCEDVDHRVLPSLLIEPARIEETVVFRSKDVDHRNLISLTGSPNETKPVWNDSQGDQDYRVNKSSEQPLEDKDYRTAFDIDNFKLPPPPPPPNMASTQMMDTSTSPLHTNMNVVKIDATKPPPFIFSQMKRPGISPRKLQDNNESIDMDLSDDDDMNVKHQVDLMPLNSPDSDGFELPPPFPNLGDDMNAKQFLDNLNETIELGEFDADLVNSNPVSLQSTVPPPHFPPPLPPLRFEPIFNNELPMLGQDLPIEWMNTPPPLQEFVNNQDFSFHGRGNNIRGNFTNRGMPRMRGSRGFGPHIINDFRGRGGRGMPWVNRGGMPFRGNNNRGGQDNRGNRGGWTGPRGNRIHRGDFRGRGNNFRGNPRGMF